MSATQADKAAAFQALHERPGAFVLPNPWDAGTARILAAQGHVALATTSAGLAFMLGRRDGAFLHNRPDLDDTIRRLQAFERAGADVLYAPGLPDLAAVRAVCAAVTRPVNVLATAGKGWTVQSLAGAGARRISVGGALSRAALSAVAQAGRELQAGTFGFLDGAMTSAEAAGFMQPG